jgi:hypothetical protein
MNIFKPITFFTLFIGLSAFAADDGKIGNIMGQISSGSIESL